MATQRPALSAPGVFAGALLAEREVTPRAHIIAREAAGALPGCAIVVYVYNAEELPPWSARATMGEISVHEALYEASTLELVAKSRQPQVFAGSKVRREQYAHLDVRRTINSLAYLPIVYHKTFVGVIEAISFDRTLDESDLANLDALAQLSATGLATAVTYESERNSNLNSITRLTQLYDIEKVFNSTLQISALMPIITNKIRELLPVQAVNLWMVDGEDLVLIARDGEDPTLPLEAPADQVIKQVGDSGKALLINNPADARLAKRNRGVERGAAQRVMVMPVIYEKSLVAALECINKSDGSEFNEDDLFFLNMMAQTAAGALHNASLMEAEKKIEILETLVEVSKEITSTLNVDRVLQVIVNAPQRIMQYDRAAVALDNRGKFQVRAISGKLEIVQNDPEVRRLREMLEWAIAADSELYVAAQGNKINADREETKTKFLEYFKATGYRGWYSLPLEDDQGRLGVLAFESRRPDFMGDAQLEMLKILAAQATVALRNASLYTEVPFIGVLEPLLQKKQQLMRIEKHRRNVYLAGAAAVLLFMAFFPLPMRVGGAATVAPQRTAQIQAEVPGVVKAVYVREGDAVKGGAVLAELEDWQYRSALAAAQAKRDEATAAMNRALAASDVTQAGIQRIQAEYWNAEVARASETLERTKLRSPIDGLVLTPYAENFVGKKLDAGDPLLQVGDTLHASVDVAVDQEDVSLLQTGQPAALKLESFPTRKFRGRVQLLSPNGGMEGDKRVFFARVDVGNSEGLLRTGMQGRGKVSVGWHAAGFVLLRDIGMRLWSKAWSWFGW